jgi:hypothetical protein
LAEEAVSLMMAERILHGRTMTRVAIDGERFLIDGRPTYEGRSWNGQSIEGLLMNSRMVQATFDDENPLTQSMWAYPDTGSWDADRNTDEFVAMVPEYRAHGLLAVTLNLQGGCPTGYFRTERIDEILSKLPWEVQTLVKQQLHGPLEQAQPWVNTALDEEGRLKESHLRRLKRVLDALDAHGMVALLGIFYFGQDERLSDAWAVRRGVEQTAKWVLEQGYGNVLIRERLDRGDERDERAEVRAPHLAARAGARADRASGSHERERQAPAGGNQLRRRPYPGRECGGSV